MLRHHEDRRGLALSLGLFPLVPALVLYQPALLPWLVPLLVYASYLSGVLSHYHNHNPIFVKRGLNEAYSLWLSAFYGFPILAWVPTHNQNHHKYVDGPGDAAPTRGRRDSLWTALTYPTLSSRGQLPLVTSYVAELKRRDRRRFWLFWGQCAAVLGLQLGLGTLAVARHGLWTGAGLYLAVGLAPALFAPWAMMFTNYLQHVDCDAASEDDHSRNFVSRAQNWLVFNAGYHTVHHEEPGVHWSDYPSLHAARAARIAPHLNQGTIAWFCVERYLLGRSGTARPSGTSRPREVQANATSAAIS